MSSTESQTANAYDQALELYLHDADFDRIGPALREARRAVDTLTRRAVERAVERHRSWTDIGAALGVTRQAAKQKYGH